jgi:hypothetical protein
MWGKGRPHPPIIGNVGGGEKHKWSAEEDGALERAVATLGRDSWNEVADFVPRRTSKQCRERWFAHLSPELTRAEWSRHEDVILVEKQKKSRQSVGDDQEVLARAVGHCGQKLGGVIQMFRLCGFERI